MTTSTPVGVKVANFDAWSVVQALWVLLTGTVIWIGRRALGRLDTLEGQAVMREDFEKAIEDIRSERRRMHDENKDHLDRIEKKIDVAAQATLLEKVRGLEAILERNRAYAEELKHIYVDPYVRAVDVLKAKVDRLEKLSEH